MGVEVQLFYNFIIFKVNNVQRPTQFESAVKDKEAAKENERPRLILQAETEYEKVFSQS
jgi:hypothetical protein